MPNLVLIQNTYTDNASLFRVLEYVLRTGIIGGYALDPEHAYQQMMMVKKAFHKTGGVQLKHFFVSLSNRDMERAGIDDLLRLGFQIGKKLGEYQLAYGVHMNTNHLHLHCVMNTVSFVDGHKFSAGLQAFWRIRALLQMRFPKTNVGIYYSYPTSSLNRYSGDDRYDEFLKLF